MKTNLVNLLYISLGNIFICDYSQFLGEADRGSKKKTLTLLTFHSRLLPVLHLAQQL